MDSPKSRAIDATVVILAVISVVYFSFLPFLYVLNYVGIDKTAGFLGIVVLTFAALTFRCLSRISIDEAGVVLHSLFVLFPIYALVRFSFTGSPIDDGNFNIRTVVAVNTVFFLLSLFCSQRKRIVVVSLLWLSSLYLLAGLYGIIAGELTFDSQTFQNIFANLDVGGGFYQNINVYLGMFVVLSLYTLWRFDNLAVRLPVTASILFSVTVMLVVGGRAGLLAVVLVAAVSLLFGLPRSASIRTETALKALFAGFVLLILGFLLSDHVLNLVENTISYRRFAMLTEGQDSSERVFLFSRAMELFSRDWTTLLFGAGINSFPAYIGSGSTGRYPHSILLELMAEYGIVGTVAFMSPIALVLFVRKSRLGSFYGNSGEERVVFLLALYWWVISSFTGALRSSWMLVFFTYLLFPSHRRLPCRNPQPGREIRSVPA